MDNTSERDAMQVRAETAAVSKKVSGMDGQQWAAYVRAHPSCTTPPGAASLIVAFFDAWTKDLDARTRELDDALRALRRNPE